MHYSKIVRALLLGTLAISFVPSTPAQVEYRTEDFRLEQRSPDIFDWFGSGVAIYRDRAAVAGRACGVYNEGAVNIYLRRATGWEAHQRLSPSPIAPPNSPLSSGYNNLGVSMLMEGEWLFVGAPDHDLPGTNDGAVFIYRWNGQSYEFVQRLQAVGPSRYGAFGYSLAWVEGDLYVGKPGHREVPGPRGAVFSFRWNGTAWTLFRKTVNDEHAFDDFGQALAYGNGYLAVGSIQGLSVMRIEPSGALTRTQSIFAPGGPTGFATEVAMDGDVLAINHPRYGSYPDRFPGRVYVYRRQGVTFVEEAQLFGDALVHPNAGNKFGSDVALHGNTLLIGAQHAYDPASGFSTGRAFLYEHDGAQWVERERLESSEVHSESQVGASVAFSADAILIGAPAHHVTGAVHSGLGLIYERPLGNEICAGVATSAGVPAELRAFGTSVAQANALTLESTDLPGPGSVVFLAGTAASAPVALGSGLLCLGSSIQRLGVTSASVAGEAVLALDLTGSGIQAGTTLAFQVWFRDVGAAGPTSNLTSAIEVTFY